MKEEKRRKKRIRDFQICSDLKDALRSEKYSISFLTFWNIIEQLFLKNSGTKLTEIVNRLKSTFPNSIIKKDVEERIDMLHKKRNLFVHEAIDRITKHDRSYVKFLVEHIITFLIDLGSKVDDIGMLEFFYQNLRKDLNKIQNYFQVLRLIKDIKSRINEDNDNSV